MGQVASEAIYFGDQKKDLWFPGVRMGGVLAKQSPTKKRIDIDTKLRSLRASKIHPLFLVNKTLESWPSCFGVGARLSRGRSMGTLNGLCHNPQ